MSILAEATPEQIAGTEAVPGGKHVKVLNVATVIVYDEHCKGCGLCVDACPKGVIDILSVFNTKGYHPAHYVGAGCTGCGICFYACPEPDAITVYKKGAVVIMEEN